MKQSLSQRRGVRVLAVAVAAGLVATLALAGCGGDDGGSEASEAPDESAGDLGEKPEVTVPGGDPPAELTYEDVVEGDGAAASPSDEVTVQYVGVLWSTGEEFDSSWDGGQPVTFPLTRVIPGWTLGVGGDEAAGIPPMKEGGRRRLVIPPELGYGEQGAPPDIPPGATLVFVVDLVQVGGGDGADGS